MAARRMTTMRYINIRFTYLLTCSLCVCVRFSHRGREQARVGTAIPGDAAANSEP